MPRLGFKDGKGSSADSSLGLVHEMRMMSRVIFTSPVGRTLWLLIAGVVLVILATACGQILLNRWNKPFFDALSRRDMHDFLYQLGVFFLIAGFLLVLNVMQRWLAETLQIRLREGLVRSLLRDWMQPRRAFWLANAGTMGVNPDQRIHEDARKLCELSGDLGIGLFQASILFGSFAGILWGLSSSFAIRVGDHDYAIPGFMVWAAVLYASAGSLLSYWVGRGLIHRNAERYAREADLRFSLVRVNEHVDEISLAAGEAHEKRSIELHLGDVLAATRRIVLGHTNLTWVTAGFGWVTIVAPILVAAPLYFTGKVSFGGLMMAAGAFTQAQSSLRWFIDNFSVIADWRATLLRVASFRHALVACHEPDGYESRILYSEGEPGAIRIDDLEIVSAANSDRLMESHVVIRSGERILVTAAPGTGKTQLFRALAGLWPWGAGRIIRPPGEKLFYLPRGTPYLPRGSLREVLAYPLKPDSFDTPACTRALYRLGLERLVPSLDETQRWDRELSQDEQLCLVFARIVLQSPPWLLIDGTLGTLDDDVRELVVDVLTKELKDTGIIHIGGAAEAQPLFSTLLHLVRAPRALAVGTLALCLFLCGSPRPVAAAAFEFHAPSAPGDPATAAALKDLAQRVLPVYQEADPNEYLDTLSVMQMVAGDYTAAYGSRQSLRDRRRPDIAHPLGAEVTLDLYAYAKMLEAENRIPFAEALAQAFDALVAPLTDQDAYAVTGWLDKSPQPFEQAVQQALAPQRAMDRIGQSEAVALIWKYVEYSAHRSVAPLARTLDAGDEARRYVADSGVRVRTPDGTFIDALVVRPRSSATPLPTLFQFSLNGATQDAEECAAHGYVGVVAYVRGVRGTVEGRPGGSARVVPFQHDGDDARAVINWIARQSWSDGRVGMYGQGYGGFTPWAAATRRPRALKAIATSAPTAPGIDFPMSGGIFHNAAFGWSARVTDVAGAQTADAELWRSLNQRWYRSGRPYRDLGRVFGQPNPIFLRWLNHPSFDRFWQSMTPSREQFARIDIPVLTMTGYFADSEPGAVYYFREHRRANGHANHTLIIAPFAGEGVGIVPTTHGQAVDPADLTDVHDLRFRWFDGVFKGGPLPAIFSPGVNYEVMGTHEWRHAPSLETMGDSSLRFYLDTAAAGQRLATPPNPRLSIVQTMGYVDRSDAAWTASGDLVTRNPAIHNALEFVSEPLPSAVEVNGLFSGRLDFSLNKVDVDLNIALYELQSNGDYVRMYAPAFEFRASYAGDRAHRRLLKAGERQVLTFQSERLTSRRLQAGSRLVMVLGIGKRPDRELNYGTGGDVSAESIADGAVPLEIHWHGGSYLEIPVRNERPDH
jgi:putative ATP-binding cassette transporter